MGYLSDSGYEHDLFVSYAHAEPLKGSTRRLIKDIQEGVALALGLKRNRDVEVWSDYQISGHEPLTAQLRSKVENSAILIVLMSHLVSRFYQCGEECQWFFRENERERAQRPVFIVQIRSTDDRRWPDIFKDERAYPLLGYNFVSDETPEYPKGYPDPEAASDKQKYYQSLSKLNVELTKQLKQLRL